MLSIAASSCAKHRVTKSEENPLLDVRDDPFGVRSAKGIEFEVLIFLRTFWIKPKSGK